jgi:hypothetical protein
VKRKKNGKLPRGSMIITRGTRMVITDSNVCMIINNPLEKAAWCPLHTSLLLAG